MELPEAARLVRQASERTRERRADLVRREAERGAYLSGEPASVWDFLGDKRFCIWTCPIAGHTRVEWREGIAHCTTEGCTKSSANFSWADADEDDTVD